jgi:UDP-N-acetylglucosamine 2-epimerase
MAKAGSPFGDGKASHRIIDVLLGKGNLIESFRPQEMVWPAFATC